MYIHFVYMNFFSLQLFNDSSDNSFLNVPDDLEVMYTDNQNNKDEGSNSTERNKTKNKTKSDTNEKNKHKTDKSDSMEKKTNKSDKNDSSERNKNKKDKNQKDKKEVVDKNETPNIVTSDYIDDNIIDISKQELPPDVFTGGNIFMHIDPTVKKKNGAKIEKKPATPPTTRIRSSQLSKFVNIRQNTININIYIDSSSFARGLRYFSIKES